MDASPDPAGLVVPTPSPAARPRLAALPARPVTRFAPAPTGYLHLGHLVNAAYAWGVAGASGGRVVLRIEDHDRQRSKPPFEAALLDDLERLGLVPDEPPIAAFRAGSTPFRQSDAGEHYREAAARLRPAGLVYACHCSRATFAADERAAGRPWEGPGCPGACRAKGLSEVAPDAAGRPPALRVALGDGSEAWNDALLGPRIGPTAAHGDLVIRDRAGNWAYPLCVVVDDQRHDITLVIRGQDLVDATPAQIRLGRLLGRSTPPTFLHHPLVRTNDGRKLSKADGATSIRSMLDAGRSPAELLGLAARLAGLQAAEDPIQPWELARLFA